MTGTNTAFFLCENKDQMPFRATKKSAGVDLKSNVYDCVCKNEHKAIKTGVKIKFPTGTYGRIAAKSGLGLQEGLFVMSNVIDPDFTGEIIVSYQ